jgi:mono/diheme cytochrome c family protein
MTSLLLSSSAKADDPVLAVSAANTGCLAFAGHDNLFATCWLVAALAILVCLNPTFARAADDNLIDQGRELFNDVCAPCHGRDMVNTSTLTADLRKFPKDATERFATSVLNGKGNGMPPWRDKLSDEDVNALWAYVRSGGG